VKVILLQALGGLVFLFGTLWLGARIQRQPQRAVAESASRVSHLLFWFGLVLPGMLGVFHPGLTHYDELLGLPALPLRPLWWALGSVLLAAGLGLMAVANRSLIRLGRGAPAFLLTERLVTDGIYGRTRNPMSLGFYLACAGLGMVAGSLAVTLGVLGILVPLHTFNLKHFEERELELRYGPSYATYRRRVPFLLPRWRMPGPGAQV
jgi:protein-S-isoprenylcysteine O-methyltransferase Ste14